MTETLERPSELGCIIPDNYWLLLQLKRTVSRDFRHFFNKKNSTWATYEQEKMFSQNFRSHSLVLVVNDYADTVLAWSLATQTWCKCGRWLRRHRVRVNDYADMCQHSQWLCRHRVNYFTLKKEKTSDKRNKHVNWYFRKLCFRHVQK